MDEAALNNVLQNLLLRFGIVSTNSDFQIVKGATIEVETKQPIEAAHHCSLRDAQLDNLVEEVCHQIPAILPEQCKSLIDSENDPALPTAVRLKDILHKPSLDVLQLCSHPVVGWPNAPSGLFGLRSIQMATI